LYMGPRYWLMFAHAVRGFTSYVLKAPSTGIEVTTLSLGTRILFVAHFLIAAIVSLFGKNGRRAFFAHITGSAKSATCRVAHLVGKAVSYLVGQCPEACVRFAFRVECEFPRIQAYRRSIRNRIRALDPNRLK
jgi:hypothetical protein